MKDCLDSLLIQTYDNIEIIAVNDGSTDDSLKILESYASMANNIKIISQKNQGQSVARNRGIEIAKGKYIHFLDADDYIQNDAYENLIAMMEKKELDLILFGAEPFLDNLNMNINLEQYDFSNHYDSKKVYSKKEFLRLNLKSFYGSSVLFLVRRELLINNKIYFKPGIIHEDVLFTLLVYLNVNRMKYDSELYYKRRFRPNSTTTIKSIKHKKKSFNSQCVILNELSNLLKEYNDRDEVKLLKKIKRSTTSKLFVLYPEINEKYKKSRILEISGFSTFKFYYWNLLRYLRRYYYWFKNFMGGTN